MKSSGIEHRSSRKWTVIIVRRFGRISSHEISGFWFKTAVFLLLVILAGSAYLFYENRNLTAQRQRLMARLVLPPSEAENEKEVVPEPKPITTTMVEQEETSATTVASVTTTTTAQDEEPPPTLQVVTPTLQGQTADSQEVDSTATTATEQQPQAQEGEGVDSERVSVTGVKLTPLKNPQGIKIAYKLVNKSQEGKKITGYTFVLARNEAMDPQVVESFPNTAVIEEGKPADHQKGIAFSIFQFKTIRGRIYTREEVREIEILVYDQEGTLLFNKTYPVPSA